VISTELRGVRGSEWLVEKGWNRAPALGVLGDATRLLTRACAPWPIHYPWPAVMASCLLASARTHRLLVACDLLAPGSLLTD
jgi:hypothetical protein